MIYKTGNPRITTTLKNEDALHVKMLEAFKKLPIRAKTHRESRTKTTPSRI